MELLRKICEEECIKKLGIKEWSSVDLIRRIHDLVAGKAFVVHVEKLDGARFEVVLRENEDIFGVWQGIKTAFGRMGKGVSVRRVREKYELVFKEKVFGKGETVRSMRIEEGCILKFKRK